MQIIPISDTYAQTFNILLGKQNCQIALYQKSTGLYCDVSVNNRVIIAGVLCLNSNRIVRDAYLGFLGDLFFYDTQGVNDPSSPGLGSRYAFYYLEVNDV